MPERPPMPRTLPPEARKEWRRVVRELERAGLLAEVDRGALIRYCEAWAAWVEVNEQIKGTGNLIRDRNGELRRNPLTFIRREHAETLTRLGAELLATPAARVRAGLGEPIPAQPAASPLDELRARRESRAVRW